MSQATNQPDVSDLESEVAAAMAQVALNSFSALRKAKSRPAPAKKAKVRRRFRVLELEEVKPGVPQAR